jgi:hypothetical protein
LATEYETAPDEVIATIRRLVNQYHPDLAETGCKIGAIFARNESGPAVKLHGVAALATIQAVSAKRRPHNEYDAEITIDGGEWDQLLPPQQDALIDHELCHLKRKEHSEKKLARLRKEDPEAVAWKIDNLGRPVLGTIPADFTPGDCFKDVIVRHGPAAPEFLGAKRFEVFAANAMAEREALQRIASGEVPEVA